MSASDQQARFRESLAEMGERRVGRLVTGRAWPATRLGWAQGWLSEQPAALAAASEQKAVVQHARRFWAVALALVACVALLALAFVVWAVAV